ncbi:hypothetical protein [Bacillus sp. Marseille-P3661]|nr:hypothetical protein [Bacillus sp. Marseille-P3661]
MFKHIDWQMLSFITASLLQEQWFHSLYVPKVYYYDIKYARNSKNNDK